MACADLSAGKRLRVEALACLCCPVCAAGLAPAGRALRCPAGHSFDIARQGYVSLLTGRSPHPGDSPAMVAARVRFLAAGHYRFLAGAIAAAAVQHGYAPPPSTPSAARLAVDASRGTGRHLAEGLALDVGGGTGYHLAAVLDAEPALAGLVLDASKAAARRAARAHPRCAAVVCDAWSRLPLADGCAQLVLSVFAPRNGPELHRIMHAGGVLVVATPTAGHLAELVSGLDLLHVDPAKRDRVEASLGGWFAPLAEEVHASRLELARADVAALVGMGPSAWHLDPAELARRVAALAEPVKVTASVRVTAYRPRRTPPPGQPGQADRSTSSQPPGVPW
ncbi:MAG TPA: 23S rRNA methyltransferase [Micromonosporaceae bacterium]|nr:23S rRNA methyltransferase [Micromonosporaceae bacterium]